MGRASNRFNSFEEIVVIDDAADSHVGAKLKGVRPIGNWRLPTSRFRAFWETFNFVVYAMNCFILPFRMVFHQRENVSNARVPLSGLYLSQPPLPLPLSPSSLSQLKSRRSARFSSWFSS